MEETITKKKRLRKERRRAENAAAPRAGLDPDEYVYIIGVGSKEDWEAGRWGSLYFIEDRNGEKALPIFTTPERVQRFVEANFGTPKAYMDMLESIGANVETHAPPLADRRYSVMPVKPDVMAIAAATIGADYLVRDPRPGEQQEVMRLSE